MYRVLPQLTEKPDTSLFYANSSKLGAQYDKKQNLNTVYNIYAQDSSQRIDS